MLIEVLSPAGSFENLVAAIKAGADAVYVGGKKYSARANASNFSQEELLDAIEYVHLYNKRIYLTINTLFKESEMNQALYDYLKPLYERGLDAVIVQDLGTFQFVKRHFPDLSIHASTQMTITGAEGAKFLEYLGADRVVTARELSLKEINHISEQTEIEIESFVHGALCYCYSGQCLYSSMIGDRSGNRGHCAQPCRLPYEYAKEGLGKKNTSYFMSLKDICTLDILPDIVEAGVTSLKIEGRMKKKEYVYLVTAMYRKYLDLYLEKGRDYYKVEQEDVDMLRDIFNRGDFHEGYYRTNNGKEMITFNKPSHAGVPVIKVLKQEGNKVTGEVLKEINKGDVVEIQRDGDDYTLGKEYREKELLTLNLRKGVCLRNGSILRRTRNNFLIDSIESKYMDKIQRGIRMKAVLQKGEQAYLELQCGDDMIYIKGEQLEKSINSPAKRENVEKQLKKTGDTPFFVETLEIEMDEDIFILNKHLNELRRKGISALKSFIVSKFERKNTNEFHPFKDKLQKSEMYELSAYVETLDQLKHISSESIFEVIYIDGHMLDKELCKANVLRVLEKIDKRKVKIFYVMPYIVRYENVEMILEELKEIICKHFDGIMIRNIESFEILGRIGYDKRVITDSNIYIFNNESSNFWSDYGIYRQTLPYELTRKEIQKLNPQNKILNIYGNVPTMVSAQCLKKTSGVCDKKSETLVLNDRLGHTITMKNYCRYCYNVVHSCNPISLTDQADEVLKLGVSEYRCNFTTEKNEEINSVISEIKGLFQFQENKTSNSNEVKNKGHFYSGVR